MKDFIGNEVSVGDHIFYSTTGRYPESRLCVITRFTKCYPVVDVLKHNSNMRLHKDVSVRNSFVKVEQ